MANKKAAQKTGKKKGIVSVVFAVLFVVLALLSLLGLFPLVQTEAVSKVVKGVGGSLRFFLPVVFGWLAFLFFQAARGKRVQWLRVVLNFLLVMVVFTEVHLFSAEYVDKNGYHVQAALGYGDFLVKSYTYGVGGGALGAVLTWPLYKNLGVWGGFVAGIAAIFFILLITGRVSKVVRYYREKLAEQREVRNERRAEELFEADRNTLLDDRFDNPNNMANAASANVARSAEARRPAGSARASGAVRSSARPSAQVLEPMPDEARSVKGGASRTARPASQRPAPSAKPTRRAAAPGTPMQAEAPEPSKKRPARRAPMRSEEELLEEAAVSTVPVRAGSKKTIYREPEQPAEAAEDEFSFDIEPEEEPVKEEAFGPILSTASSGFSLIKEEKEEKPVVGEPFKPARTSRAKDKSPKKDDFTTKKHTVNVDGVQALRIEPDEYELPDEDVAPFDVSPSYKKSLGKLRRAEPAEEEEEGYNYPPIDLLAHAEEKNKDNTDQLDLEKAELLCDTLHSFGIETKLTGIAHGPAVTRFELQPAPGVKVSRITSLSDDIALNLAAERVRIEAPIPGKAAVGVEIPNESVETVFLRDVLESADARRHTSRVAVGLGKDNSGRYIVTDIAKMPHVLIAGQTGSGKSVCINSIIVSILFRATPEEVRLILIDPKVVELSVYNDIPHLIAPVVTDPKKAASALEWAVMEMTQRYKRFAERGVRDIKGYNKALEDGEKPMPQIVIIIDELADLMMVAPGEVEDSICRLAQLARAAGMHLVIATQRPSVNVITGIIKANIPTRIAFSVASQVDSRTMIDHGGAEKLLGNGDMLFVPSGISKPLRVQGAWVSDKEVHAVTDYIKQRHETTYDEDVVEKINLSTMSDAEKEETLDEYDARLPEAVEIVIEAGQASISMLQRRMRVGYARAGRLIDEMAQRGIVSEADGAKPRSVLITREQFQQMFEEDDQ